MTEVLELKEGDIFRWSYREAGNDAEWGRYHCKSQIGIVRQGRIIDTFWGGSGAGSMSFGVDDLNRINLIYLGNFSDLEKRSEHEGDYYDAEDIVNLNHSNSSRGNFYLRKGAKRSRAKMMETALHDLGRARADAKTASERAARLEATIAEIETGDLDKIYIY